MQEPNHDNMAIYVVGMEEIKQRMKVIDHFLGKTGHAIYGATTTETIGLQFRKIFELIALSSLASNKTMYSQVHSDFAKHWEASKLIKNLEKINPDFYPNPIAETPSTHDGLSAHFAPLDSPYLTKGLLIEGHGRCGALMHAANPFGKKIDYNFYDAAFPTWREQVINLLNCHTIHLFDDPGFYLVHLKEDYDDKIHWYRFEPTAPTVSAIVAPPS